GQERPVGSQSVYPDYLVSNLIPGLVVAGLLERDRRGTGPVLDVAQVEARVFALGISYVEAALGGTPEPLGNRRPGMSPHGIYPCRGEDEWCAVTVEDDAQWAAMLREMYGPAVPDQVAGLGTADARLRARDE